MKPDDIDLTEAGNIYLIANTPLFLMRRLQEDPAPDLLSRNFTSEEVLVDLRRVLEESPEDPVQAVRPFVYLLALRNQALRGGSSADIFFVAARLTSHFHPWYATVARTLETTFVPQVNETVWVSKATPLEFHASATSAIFVEVGKE